MMCGWWESCFEVALDFGAAVGEGEADGLVLGEAFHFGFDLDGELAGGDDDDGLERAAPPPPEGRGGAAG